ncbi:MAG: hypothetical protein PHD57_08925 [Desulfobacterales bacterium]|nr:hypothetical protein [Desulfobacterales bacterium]MDD3082117.1 hypothetical protein [Desulfobacterales bacterium]MDD3950311.1 hypothetical protein [Desulfobacterales bacterium]
MIGIGVFLILSFRFQMARRTDAYLIEGSQKTALLDTINPAMADELMAQLAQE